MELMIFARFEWRYIVRSPLFWVYISLGLFLFPSQYYDIFQNNDPNVFIQWFHVQMVVTLLIFPIFIGRTLNEETERYVPQVLLTKVKRKELYILGKSLVIWLVPWLAIMVVNTGCMLALSVLGKGAYWLVLAKLGLISLATLMFYSSILTGLSILIKRLIYVILIIIVYVMTSLEVDNIWLALWVKTRPLKIYIMQNAQPDFWLSRLLLFVCGCILCFIWSRIYIKGLK